MVVDNQGYVRLISHEACGNTNDWDISDSSAPEMINKQKIGFHSDFWSFGIFILKMFNGDRKINIKNSLELSGDFSYNLKNLLEQLLNIDPIQRIRGNDIRNHA